MNVNMISCAGQATIPIVHAVSRIQSVGYAEIVASLASKSIGPGTRANLDEFTYTTSNAICKVGGARKRQGAGDHQPGRAADDHAQHHLLPDRRRAGPRRASAPRSCR